MKKFLAMSMVCMLMAMPVLAESDASADKYAGFSDKVSFGSMEKVEPEMEASYFGEWVTVKGEDGGCIDLYLPTLWEEFDVKAEDKETVYNFDENAIYASAGGDGIWGMDVIWTATEEAVDAAVLQAQHEGSEIVTLNDVDFVRYTDAEKDAVVLLWARPTGVYSIAFGPASDTDITEYVEDMIASVKAYEAVEE